MNAALEQLASGGVVAAPTETLYGLLADATRADAVTHLLELKPRGREQGIPLILPSRAAWRALVAELPPLAEQLADAFWPGPLTIALRAAASVDARVTLDGYVAVRLPGASPAGALARELGRPLTATSANPPGAPPAQDAGAVRAAFADAVADGRLVVVGAGAGESVSEGEAGGMRQQSPSTVVRVNGSDLVVVRPGAISQSALRAVMEKH